VLSEAGGQEHTNGSAPVLSCCQSSHCTPWRACCHAIFSPSSNAASRDRLQCAWCWRWRASSAGHGKIAAFPPLWSVKELNESFVVQDATGQPLAYVYYEDEPQTQMSTRLISRDEARRITAEHGEAAGRVAKRVNEAFVSRRVMMDREMVGRQLDDLLPGDSMEIDKDMPGMLFTPSEAAGVIDPRTRSATKFAQDHNCRFLFNDGCARRKA
jgi:hypothetical protein